MAVVVETSYLQEIHISFVHWDAYGYFCNCKIGHNHAIAEGKVK